MNAFDLVVTVALGSTLATIILNKNVALAEGALAFAMLTGLQYAVAWLSIRSPLVERVVKSEPAMLLYHGEYLHDSMRRERITEDEIKAAVRSQGFAGLGDIKAVVLETDSQLSVISLESPLTPPSSLPVATS